MLSFSKSDDICIVGCAHSDLTGSLDDLTSTLAYMFRMNGEQFHGKVKDKL